jgi:hypothetical protein
MGPWAPIQKLKKKILTTKPFTLANFSIVSLVFIFRCSSTTTNPVCERRVNLLVYSLSLHRHSYIGFILAFASSIHNKQTKLRVAHDRVGSSADPALNGHLRYPNNLDQSLHDTTSTKVRKYRAIGKLTAFFAVSGVMSSQSDRGFFHYLRTVFSSMLKPRVGNILVKSSALRINLNIDGSSIASKSHTHPSHSQTSF